MVWDWQIDAALNGWRWSEDNRPPEYFREWNREHPEAHARIVARYRRTHREETLRQWARDTRAYEERVGHDVIRERNRAAVRKYMARKRAERKALKEAERNLLSVESDRLPEERDCAEV